MTAVSKNKVRSARDSALIGLTSGFLVGLGEAVCEDMDLLTRETVNTAVATTGSIMLSYLNMDTSQERNLGIVSANIAHRVSYYGTRAIFGLMRAYS